MHSRPGRLWLPEAPHIVRARTTEAEITLPGPRFSGHLRLEVGPGLSRGARPRQDTGWFRNMIVSSGFDYMVGLGGDNGNSYNLWRDGYLEVGTGVTAVNFNQTTLAAPLARTTNNGSISGSPVYVVGPPDYWSFNSTRLFTESQAVGAVSELGFFALNGTAALGSGSMGNRQRVLDQNGVETVLNKTAEDQLRVTFQIRVYPPAADVVGGQVTLTGLGTTHDFVVRALNASSSLAWPALLAGQHHIGATGAGYRARAVESNVLAARTAAQQGSSAGDASSATVTAYVQGQHYRDLTHTWEPGVANFNAGIGLVTDWVPSGQPLFQVSFTQPILKTNTRRLRLTLRRSLAAYP